MKRTSLRSLTAAALLFFFLHGESQVTSIDAKVFEKKKVPIGKVIIASGKTKYVYASLDYEFKGKDTVLVFGFANHSAGSYADVKEMQFKGNQKSIEDLYQLLMGAINHKGEEEYKKVLLPENGKMAIVSNTKGFQGLRSVPAVLLTYDDGYTELTQKQVDDLFGRRQYPRSKTVR